MKHTKTPVSRMGDSIGMLVAFDTYEAAERLALHPETFRLRCRKGLVLGAIKVGARWRIPAAALSAILAQGMPNEK